MKLMEEVANYRAQESVLKQRVEQKQVCNCCTLRVYQESHKFLTGLDGNIHGNSVLLCAVLLYIPTVMRKPSPTARTFHYIETIIVLDC